MKKPVSHSILELALISEGSSSQKTLQQSLDLAQKAEEWGYTRFWLAEHHNAINIASSATSVLIGYIAGGTSKIRIGSGGIMLPNHSPIIIAEQFGTLASLYPNRIDLGLGRAPGTDQKTANEIRPDRMKAVYQFPQEVEKLRFYFSEDHTDDEVRAPIAEGTEVPMYILGSSTDSAHVAAKMGLPYSFATHFAPNQFYQAIDIYRNEFVPSEYLKEPYVIAGVNVVIGETAKRAEQLSTTLLRSVLGILTGKREYMHPPTEMTPELREFSQHPAVQQFIKFAMVGTKEDVKAMTIDFLEQSEVDEIIVTTHMYNHADRLYSYQAFSEIMEEINCTQELQQNLE